MGNIQLFAIENDLGLELSFENLNCHADDRVIPDGLIYMFGQNLQGCDIPDCSGAKWWDGTAISPVQPDTQSSGQRMLIYGGQNNAFWLNLFKINSTIYYCFGNGDYPTTLTTIPGTYTDTGQKKLLKLTPPPASSSDPATLLMSDYNVQFTPSDNIQLFAIQNNLAYPVTFQNLEYESDDVSNIAPGVLTHTPGGNGQGQGCAIPDCSGSQWWGPTVTPGQSQDNTHRMAIYGGPGNEFWLNLFKINADIYYSFGNGAYPTVRMPLVGASQGDGNPKYLTLNSPTDVSIDDFEAAPLPCATANWMETLAAEIDSHKLWEIAIPGTHDSGTGGIDVNSPGGIAPDAATLVEADYKVTPGYVAGWSKAQGRSIAQQLQDGIRYLDLRACLVNNALHFCHSVICEPAGTQPNDPVYSVNGALTAIQQFLTEHSKEIVILDFQHFYAMDLQHHQNLADQLLQLFGSLMSAPWGNRVPTIGTMKISQRVIILYPSSDEAGGTGLQQILSNPKYSQLWPRDSIIQSNWANTDNIDSLAQYLNVELSNKPTNKFWVWQCQLNFTYPVLTPGSSLQDLADGTTNPRMWRWITATIAAHAPNILILDWYSDTDWYLSTGLNYNAKLQVEAAAMGV